MKSGIIAVNAGMIFLIGIVVGRVAEVLSEKEDIEKEATLTQTIRAATGTVDFHDQKVIDSHQRPRVKRINFDFEDHPKLDRFPFRDLADFEDLEELNLGVCNVGGDMLDGLVSLSKLKKLELSHCVIGDRGFENLSKMKALEFVKFWGG